MAVCGEGILASLAVGNNNIVCSRQTHRVPASHSYINLSTLLLLFITTAKCSGWLFFALRACMCVGCPVSAYRFSACSSRRLVCFALSFPLLLRPRPSAFIMAAPSAAGRSKRRASKPTRPTASCLRTAKGSLRPPTKGPPFAMPR